MSIFISSSYAVEMQMIHVENEFIKPDGSVDWEKAAMDEAGVAVISVLFRVDNMKPQNQRPINVSQLLLNLKNMLLNWHAFIKHI